MDPQSIYTKSTTPNVPYTNCQTRILNLLPFEIPQDVTEDEYRSIYKTLASEKTLESRLLSDAVNSITYGISPPVAFPTETVYGLCADATNRASIAGIFAAKGRPSDNPLIVHVASKEHLERLTGEPLPAVYEKLVGEYWPGPLTILIPVPKNSVFAPNVHPGQMTIGFRVPASKYARFFIAATDRPLAAPSANSSGKPSPTTAEHVREDMQGKINFILDGGDCDVGVESTVVDGLCDPPLILRPGGVSQDDLIRHGKKHGSIWVRTAIGYKQAQHGQIQSQSQGSSTDSSEAPRAPGMKYKHYAPNGKLILVENRQTYGRVNAEIDHIIDLTMITTDSALSSAINGVQEPDPTSDHSLTIAILTSSTWSPFTDLALDTLHQPYPSAAPPPPITTASSPHLNGETQIRITHTEQQQQQQQHTPSKPIQVQKAAYRSHTIYSIDLGRTPKAIAKSLFAALRTCDTLGCTFILAEVPLDPSIATMDSKSNAGEQRVDHDYYDAVMERMRKAASMAI